MKLTALLFVFLCSVSGSAQDVTYGQPSDLKGLKKIYVSTGKDTNSRNKIVSELEKSKFGFEIADDIESADIGLFFGAGSVEGTTVATTTGSTTSIYDVELRSGDGVVYARARGKVRLVHSFSDVQNNIFEGKPVNNFVKEFLKLYKKANR